MFICLFVALPIRGAADSYLDDNGKMEMKVDRVEKTDEEKQNIEKEKTELDRQSIDLFKPATENEIKEKKKKEQEELDTLYNSLFLDESKASDVTNTLESLFHEGYEAEQGPNEANYDDSTTGETNGKMLAGLLIAGVVLICIGIYTILRKSWR